MPRSGKLTRKKKGIPLSWPVNCSMWRARPTTNGPLEKLSQRAAENERLADTIEKIHEESPDKGYRRLNDDLRHDHGIHVNDKRVLRICRARDIRSTIKHNNHGCTRRAKNPQYLAENLLDRQFYAAKPNEKWLTDVTEFKWFEGVKVQKALSERHPRPLRSAHRVPMCSANAMTIRWFQDL